MLLGWTILTLQIEEQPLSSLVGEEIVLLPKKNQCLKSCLCNSERENDFEKIWWNSKKLFLFGGPWWFRVDYYCGGVLMMRSAKGYTKDGCTISWKKCWYQRTLNMKTHWLFSAKRYAAFLQSYTNFACHVAGTVELELTTSLAGTLLLNHNAFCVCC